MTLYDLTNEITLQGDICIKVFDPDGNEKETRHFYEQTDFNTYCENADDLDDLEVSFIYPLHAIGGGSWVCIELQE